VDEGRHVVPFLRVSRRPPVAIVPPIPPTAAGRHSRRQPRSSKWQLNGEPSDGQISYPTFCFPLRPEIGALNFGADCGGIGYWRAPTQAIVIENPVHPDRSIVFESTRSYFDKNAKWGE
jgi:hypothetical protein